jgi:CRISPR-associated protein Csx16
MRCCLVTRHPALLAWARERKIACQHLTHLEPAAIQAGVQYVGNLPLSLAAAVCASGRPFVSLDVACPVALRGREFDAADLRRLGVRAGAYMVRRLEPDFLIDCPEMRTIIS